MLIEYLWIYELDMFNKLCWLNMWIDIYGIFRGAWQNLYQLFNMVVMGILKNDRNLYRVVIMKLGMMNVDLDPV